MRRALVRECLLVLLGVSGASSAAAQLPAPPFTARTSLYAELGGPGGLYSLGGDFLVTEHLAVRAGGSLWSVSGLNGVDESVQVVILGASRLWDVSDLLKAGPGRYAVAGMEIVAGSYQRVANGATTVDGTYASLSPHAGLRLQQASGGLFLRLAFTPLIPIISRANAFPGPSVEWKAAGISIGYTF